MDKVNKILGSIVIISFVTFVTSTYLGIVGFKSPWVIMKWINLISLVIFVISGPIYYIINFVNDLKTGAETETSTKEVKGKEVSTEKEVKKSKTRIILDYILPVIVIISIYLWSHFVVTTVQISGSHIAYNPLSVLGLGPMYTGTPISSDKTNCTNRQNIEMKTMKGGGDAWYIRIINTFITILSTSMYMFGGEALTGLGMIHSVFVRTLFKMLLGYVPTNNELKKKNSDSYLMEFVQYRAASDGIFSKLAALYRKFWLMGLDMPAVDVIFNDVSYNNVAPTRALNTFCENKKEYEKGGASFIGNWKWETLPYVYQWLKFSSVGYILAIILIVIRIFVK